MKAALALTMAMLLSVALPAAATQWKWRDATGRVQYSDRPPPHGVADKDILARPSVSSTPGTVSAPSTPSTVSTASAPSAASGAASSVASPASGASAAGRSASSAGRSDPVQEAKRREAERAEAAKQKAEVEKQAFVRAENCQRARAHLRTLEDGMRIARVNARGEREILDDKSRAAEIDRARAVIVSDCR